ncbi:MAG: hypothetical protein LKE40_04090 [Spirochaetia bacterium]|jgi:tetratricopeptide (TPR) repeat protein|nr:hypothetical protein [Spirochaetia bacterium]
MTDYFQQLILEPDIRDLKEFARRQDLIAKFQKEKRDAFNRLGPFSLPALVYEGRLYDLYTAEGEYDTALQSAKTIYQGLSHSKEQSNDSVVEAFLNLGESYLNMHDVMRAGAIAAKANLYTTGKTEPQYHELMARLAKANGSKDKELSHYIEAYKTTVANHGGNNTRLSNLQAALALCYEKQGYFQNATYNYTILLRDADKLELSAEERISLEARRAYCLSKNGQPQLAKQLMELALAKAKEQLRPKHPTTIRIEKLMEQFPIPDDADSFPPASVTEPPLKT